MPQNQSDIYFFQDALAELYPFTETELGFYKGVLDFKSVSANKKISWSYELIKEFEELWDWNILNSNKAVFEKVTLGLLFPDKVDLPECDCCRMEEFCEDVFCWQNAERLSYQSNLFYADADTYVKIAILCDIEFITEEILFDIYMNEDKSDLESFMNASFS